MNMYQQSRAGIHVSEHRLNMKDIRAAEIELYLRNKIEVKFIEEIGQLGDYLISVTLLVGSKPYE